MDDQGHVSALLFSNDVVDGNESQSCSREFGRSVRGVRVRRIGKDEGEKGEREWDEDDDDGRGRDGVNDEILRPNSCARFKDPPATYAAAAANE